jgi:hypothetical protein
METVILTTLLIASVGVNVAMLLWVRRFRKQVREYLAGKKRDMARYLIIAGAVGYLTGSILRGRSVAKLLLEKGIDLEKL